MADKCPECGKELGYQKHTLFTRFCSDDCEERFMEELRTGGYD